MELAIIVENRETQGGMRDYIVRIVIIMFAAIDREAGVRGLHVPGVPKNRRFGKLIILVLHYRFAIF